MLVRVAISRALLSVVLLEACAPGPTEADHRQVLIETLQAAGRAIAAGDVDGLLSHWTDDVVIYPVAEPPALGKEAVRRYVLRNRAQGTRPRIAPTDIVASAAGDLGYVVGTHDWVNDQGEASMPGRYVTLWRRTEEGRWRMFLEIHSPSPESDLSPGGNE